MQILVINPGGGSTKVAVFHNKRRREYENIVHSPERLARFKLVLDQYRLRKEAVNDFLDRHKVARAKLDAIATRGGPLLPVAGGVYRVTIRIVADIRRGRVQAFHPSLLGPLVSYEIAEELGIPAYLVDPESTDEFWDVSRVSGLKGVDRLALSHAVSCRAVARAAAHRLKKGYARCNLVVVHLGTGITVAAHVRGRQVDATNANDDGPFSTQRTGTLPLSGLIRLCFSGRYSEADVLDLVQRKGGLLSYLGTDDVRRVEQLVSRRNREAARIYNALAYQIAKEIGAYLVVCGGKADAVVLTGGLAKSERLVAEVKKWVRPLCRRVLVFAGDEEMPALAERVLAVLQGREKAKVYDKEIAVRR